MVGGLVVLPIGIDRSIAHAETLTTPSHAPAVQTPSDRPTVDNTVTRIRVHTNGTATWTVQIRTRLENQSDIDAYRAFQDQFRSTKAQYREQFRDRMRTVVANAANATGRDMQATGFTASTSIQEMPRQWGVITYRLTWYGFAPSNDTAVVVGDVFQGGFYLAADDILTIEPASPEQSITTVKPSPDSTTNASVTWVGATDFSDGRPYVRISHASSRPGGPGPGSDGVPVTGLLLGGLGIFAVVIGIVLGNRYVSGQFPFSRSQDDTATDTPDSETSEADLPYNTELLTDEELVLAYLDDHGRVPQSDIGEAFDWSSSKTSRVLADMVDDGTVRKLRRGRKNLIEPVDDESTD